jgi:hypothetical protein
MMSMPTVFVEPPLRYKHRYTDTLKNTQTQAQRERDTHTHTNANTQTNKQTNTNVQTFCQRISLRSGPVCGSTLKYLRSALLFRNIDGDAQGLTGVEGVDELSRAQEKITALDRKLSDMSNRR